MLLEVVLALGILLMSMVALGGQFYTAVQTADRSERLTQANMLAEAKLAQLDIGAIPIEVESDGDFGKLFPGYFWRITIEPHEDLPDLFLVLVEILYAPAPDPEQLPDIDDAELLVELRTFRPTPATIDMRRDFGMSEEQLADLTDTLPPELADPTNISPAVFRELDQETLLLILPQLMGVFGQGFGFSKDQIQQAIDQGLLDPSNLTGSSGGAVPQGSDGGNRGEEKKSDE